MLIISKSSETYFDLVACKIGAKLHFSSNYGYLWGYFVQLSKNFEYNIDYFSKNVNRKNRKIVFFIGTLCIF